MLVFLVGGARSGKSDLAVSLASREDKQVTVIATAEALDDEMRVRIDAHRAERPAGWDTVEEPLELEQAIEGVEAERTLVVDCLSLWVANLLGAGVDEPSIRARGEVAAAAAVARPGLTLAVSNEVGLGIVPATPLGRVYRDLLGTVNRSWASAAAESVLVVSGLPVRLEPADTLLHRLRTSG